MEGIQEFILSRKENHRTNTYTKSPTNNIMNQPVLSKDLRWILEFNFIKNAYEKSNEIMYPESKISFE